MRYCMFWGLAVLCIVPAAGASEPDLTWEFRAQSNLYAPPLVADVHPAPGLETILSDSEVRCLRCIDARGKQVWEYDGGWKKRLISAAAFSSEARPGKGTLLIANGDGTVCCVDAATGKGLWRREVGSVDWGGVLWCDLDADGRDEAVIGTADAGIVALRADGESLWTCTSPDDGPKLDVSCPLAAADIEGDGRYEVFAVDQWGPLCLNSDGTLRWRKKMADSFSSSPVIADADGDGHPELYCSSRDDHALLAFDAESGTPLWRFPMMGGADVYPSSSTAVGDVDGDGRAEIIAVDSLGYVYCVDAAGERLWTFPASKRVHAAPSLGDVDGDGEVEVLVACGDHFLYCLNAAGELEWRYEAGLRLIHPATITDVDLDGKTDILFGGSDRVFRCLTLGGRYVPSLVPWPSRRFDAAQRGASWGRECVAAEAAVMEETALIRNGGFEQAKLTENAAALPKDSPILALRNRRPREWHLDGFSEGEWTLDRAVKRSGTASLKLGPGAKILAVASGPAEVAHGLESVRAQVYVHGEGTCSMRLRWEGLNQTLREDPLPRVKESEAGGWTRYSLGQPVAPPRGARWLALVCEARPGPPVWIDDAEVAGTSRHARALCALVNQVGYDTHAPKRFVVRSNFLAEEARFTVVDEQGKEVFSGELESAGRIHGAFGHDWGYHFWRGDFSEFDKPGTYRINVGLGGVHDMSWPFEVAEHALWARTARPAYRFFYYQRCGMAIPGFHEACHLDDARGEKGVQYDLHGGWHDAGDYNTYHNAPYVLGLVRAYTVEKDRFDTEDRDATGVSDFLEEILWGGDHSRRMIAPDGSAFGGITSGYGFWGPPELETDNLPGTGDERPFDHAPDAGRDPYCQMAASARIARFIEKKSPYIEAAQRAFEWRQTKGKKDVYQLGAALDLHEVTKDQRYADIAEALLSENGPERLAETAPHEPVFSYLVDAVERGDRLFGMDRSEALRAVLVKKAESILELAQNPFGVYTRGPKEKPNFFGTAPDHTGWHVGTSSYLLNTAAAMALGYRYNPDSRYLAFVYDQFNWTLGGNPFGICLMEGAGSAHLPSYHHRYAFAGVPRGAVPGGVVNGVTYRASGDDRPHLDLRGLDIPDFEPNEVWLPHNTAYLNALANLAAARPAP